MTGSRNGTVTLWKDKRIQNSFKLSNEWTLVYYKNDCIFAASENKVVELNMNLDEIKKFKGRNGQPLTIDASEEYLVIGYKMGNSVVDVHSRKEIGQDGVHQRMVSKDITKLCYEM